MTIFCLSYTLATNLINSTEDEIVKINIVLLIYSQSPRGGGIGSRKPGRTYDDNANYENHNHHNSTSSASRGNPSSRVVVPSAVSPQPPVVQGNSPQHQSGKSNFEMEANAFPPLPGANTEGNRPARNGDSTTER